MRAKIAKIMEVVGRSKAPALLMMSVFFPACQYIQPNAEVSAEVSVEVSSDAPRVAETPNDILKVGASAINPPTISVHKVSARVDFREDDTNPAADQFYDTLNAHYGQVIDLKLTLVAPLSPLGERSDPRSGPYMLLRQSSEHAETQYFGCSYHLIQAQRDQVTSYAKIVYELSFQHPAHYHNPTQIRGEGSVTCQVKRRGDQRWVEATVTGQFIPLSRSIPTALEHLLFPASPVFSDPEAQ